MPSSIINHLGLNTNSKITDDVHESDLETLKSNLDSYKDVILFLDSILNWKKDSNGYLQILAATFTLYAIIWKLCMPVLCLLSLLCLAFVLFDYVYQNVLMTSSKTHKDWSNDQKKQFNQVCASLASAQKQIRTGLVSFREFKEESPFWACACTSSVLLLLALLASCLGDLLFSYLLLNSIVLYPGLKSNGILDNATVYVFTNLTKFLRTIRGAASKEKSL